jgi:transcriptional regulator with XRE-family HTH domain
MSERHRSPSRQKNQRKGASGVAPAPSEERAAQAPTTAEVDVGMRLRQLRVEHKLSIRSLAAASGLSVNTLSLIENGRSSPSVSTLQRVATALGMPINAFFEGVDPPKPVAFVKAAQRQRATFTHGGLEELGAGMAAGALQPFLITLEPRNGSGSQDIVHTGYEFVFCLAGQLTYTIDGQTYLLEAGDSLLFESHLPHRWHNAEAMPAQALLILAPSDARDRPTARHFATGTTS